MNGQKLPKKFLNVSHSSVTELMNDDSLKIYINGYAYTAITGRNITVKTGVTSITCEDGLNRSDNAYKEPTDMSFTIVVSKLNTTEYKMLLDLYRNRTLISFQSLAFSCKYAIISSFEVSDEYIDVLTIDISIHEVLVSGSGMKISIESPMQMESQSDSPNQTSAQVAPSNIADNITNKDISCFCKKFGTILIAFLPRSIKLWIHHCNIKFIISRN